MRASAEARLMREQQRISKMGVHHPETCELNNPRWSWGRGSRGSAYMPKEVNNMRNNNPCLTCKVRKACTPLKVEATSPHKKVNYHHQKVQKRGKKDITEIYPKVKGELLNSKRQLGLAVGVLLNKKGNPKTDNNGFEIRGTIKVQYPRIIDMPRKVDR